MAKLDELGLRENTIVLYSSDHGDMLGSQDERLKRSLGKSPSGAGLLAVAGQGAAQYP